MSGTNPNPYDYAVVPDSYTQMDQLKISGQITDDTKAYAFLMAGSTINEEIDMERWFNDVDIRLTNTSIKNVTITGYGKIYNEDESLPNLANVTAVNQGPATALGDNSLPTTAQVAYGDCPSDRLSQIHGRSERRVAALGRRIWPGRVGNHRRL